MLDVSRLCEIARNSYCYYNTPIVIEEQTFQIPIVFTGRNGIYIFVEDLDTAEEVCVYAKLPKGFHIPTPVGNYSPDWAIAFNEGTVKHIYFIAETKGTMESLNLRPIEQAKISCAKKLFNEISTSNVKYHDVDSYQTLLTIMNKV